MKHKPYEHMKEAHCHTDGTTWCRCKDLQAEIDRLKAWQADHIASEREAIETIQAHRARIVELESRYAGAVEVEGITDERGNGNTMLRLNTKIGVGTGQRVKVLLMPKEVE